MSDEEGAPSTGSMENNIRAAYDRLPEIMAKRKTARILRLLLPLAVLAIVLIGLWMMWSTLTTNVFDRKDELFAHFQGRSGGILPRVERQVKESAERVLPRLRGEMAQAQANAQAKLGDVISTHTSDMGERLDRKMNERLEAALARVSAGQRLKLQQTFPDQLKCNSSDTAEQCQKKEDDLDRIMDEIQRSYRDWAIQEMRTTFDGHLKAMDDIRKTMTSFAQKPAEGEEGEPASAGTAPGDMLMMFLELVAESLGGSNELFEEQGVTDTPEGK